jgi:hypothetical protein
MDAVKGKRLERKAEKAKEAERLKKEGVVINGHLCGGTNALKKAKNERTQKWQQKKKSAGPAKGLNSKSGLVTTAAAKSSTGCLD